MEAVEQAASRVKRHLWSQVGNMTVPGVPRFDNERGVWRVPILCDTARGILPIGEAQLDQALNFVQLPSKADLDAAAHRQLRATPVLVFADPDELRAKGFDPVTA